MVSKLKNLPFKDYTSSSLLVTCQNEANFCARGEDKQFYTLQNKKQHGIAYMGLYCDKIAKGN